MFNVLLTKNLKKRILNKFEMSIVKLKSSTFTIIVFYQLKEHIYGSTFVYVFALRLCCGEGTTKAGAGRVVPQPAGWVLPRWGPGGRSQGGPGGFYRRGASGYYRGGLLLILVLSLAQRPFCRPSPKQSCDVSKTINIITYTDV